ncbi:hypothetical protein PG997_001591 [Apiospora hydei]|uniref:Uncharacterized protein n=1 Tax=Apiospora hydei TaxID=1337664 RepID=A0ABR1XE58_9PEZI
MARGTVGFRRADAEALDCERVGMGGVSAPWLGAGNRLKVAPLVWIVDEVRRNEFTEAERRGYGILGGGPSSLPAGSPPMTPSVPEEGRLSCLLGLLGLRASGGGSMVPSAIIATFSWLASMIFDDPLEDVDALCWCRGGSFKSTAMWPSVSGSGSAGPQDPHDTASPEGFRTNGALGGLRFSGEVDTCLDGGSDGGISPPRPRADSWDRSVTGVSLSSRLPSRMSRGLLPLLMVRLWAVRTSTCPDSGRDCGGDDLVPKMEFRTFDQLNGAKPNPAVSPPRGAARQKRYYAATIRMDWLDASFFAPPDAPRWAARLFSLLRRSPDDRPYQGRGQLAYCQVHQVWALLGSEMSPFDVVGGSGDANRSGLVVLIS